MHFEVSFYTLQFSFIIVWLQLETLDASRVDCEGAFLPHFAVISSE